MNLLMAGATLGDKIYVGVSTDDFNQKKGKIAFESQFFRRRALERLPFVTEVFWEYDMEQKVRDIWRFDIDIFIIGDDWKGKFDYLTDYCVVRYHPRTPGISSTLLRSQLEVI